MPSTKRAAPSGTAARKNKSKKSRPADRPTPLGAFVNASAVSKDEDELELEEAVFGTSRGTKTSVWDLAEEDTRRVNLDGQDEDSDEEDTGLERLKDENVSARSGALSFVARNVSAN